MLDTQAFVDYLVDRIEYFSGVPDSLLKNLNACLINALPPDNFSTAVDEGSAVALCAGYTLATGKPGAVYLQNSGLGNIINPILSLNDSLVYGIPVLLLIGWRGEPERKDEPQHKKQGMVTIELLEACGIEYEILPDEINAAKSAIDWAMGKMETNCAPVAIVVRKNTFSSFEYPQLKELAIIKREDAIKNILLELDDTCRVVSTTGMISRELYELRELCQQGHQNDFLTVGSMGYTSQIALGLALQKTELKVICLDGDGSFLMHMGAIPTIGAAKPLNYIHILLDNETHDSVGGQATIIGCVDVLSLAKSCGYKHGWSASNADELRLIIRKALITDGPLFIHVKVCRGARDNLGRPKESPVINKQIFVENL